MNGIAVEPKGTRRGFLRTGVVAIAATVALVAAGCGADVGGDSKSTISIGLPHPLTGAWADGGQNAVNGAMMAIEDINQAGGIKAMGGAQLKGVQADTSSTDPGQAASVTRRLVEKDQVSALVGAYVSAFTITASTEAEKSGVPMVSQSFTDTLTERGYKNFFQLPPVSSKIGASTVPYVRDAFAAVGINLQKVSVVASNDASIRSQGEGAIKQAKDAGLSVVSEAFYQQDLTDASVLAQDVVRNKPDIVFLGGPTGAAVTIVRTLRSLGYQGPIVGLGGGGMLTPDFGKMLGESVNGVLSLASWNWDMPYEDISDVNKRYMEHHKVPFMSHEAGQSYAAVWVIKEALEKAGKSDPAEVAAALRQLDLSSGPGSLMPGNKVKFTDVGRNETVFPIMVQWQEGVTKTVWPEDVKVVDPK